VDNGSDYCTACFDCNYPTPVPADFDKYRL